MIDLVLTFSIRRRLNSLLESSTTENNILCHSEIDQSQLIWIYCSYFVVRLKFSTVMARIPSLSTLALKSPSTHGYAPYSHKMYFWPNRPSLDGGVFTKPRNLCKFVLLYRAAAVNVTVLASSLALLRRRWCQPLPWLVYKHIIQLDGDIFPITGAYLKIVIFISHAGVVINRGASDPRFFLAHVSTVCLNMP